MGELLFKEGAALDPNSVMVDKGYLRASSKLSCDFPATPEFCRAGLILMPWKSDGRRDSEKHSSSTAFGVLDPSHFRMGGSLLYVSRQGPIFKGAIR